MKFEILEKDKKSISEWIKKADNIAIEKQKKEFTKEEYDFYTKGLGFPYTGIIGGNITYSFTPTGLGVITKITHKLTGEVLDLTDYDSW